MDIQQVNLLIENNLVLVVGIMALIIIVMLVLLINNTMKINYMRKRYRKMMTGVDGMNMERMLLGHIDETRTVSEANKRLREDITRIDELLGQAITRVGIVRFSAFTDMGSDLSYAVALLDSHNNGVVLTSIFGREDSRSYAKPIERGESTYTLTAEEQQALNEAMAKD